VVVLEIFSQGAIMQTAELRTSEALLRKLQDAVRRKQTRQEIDRQRISFVYGSMSFSSDITKEEVESLVNQQAGIQDK